MHERLQALRAFDVHLFRMGKVDVSLLDLAWLVVAITLLFVFAGWLRGWIAHRLLARSRLEPGTRQAVATIVRYLVLISGVMVIMETMGINLTTFNVLAGAFGVGLAFGLQDIFKNFISGLIIMFDRPIHIGDRIEIAGVGGDVVDIGARRITMTTPEGVTIVVPNAKLITDSVKNLQGPHSAAAVEVNVNVSRDSDPRLAQRLLYEVASESGSVLEDPAPFVILKAPTGNAFPFTLRVWSPLRDRARDELLNELHYALHEKFSAGGVKLV